VRCRARSTAAPVRPVVGARRRARTDDGVQKELRVILAIDPTRVHEQVQQVIVRRSDRLVIARIVGVDRVEVRGTTHRSIVERASSPTSSPALRQDLTVESLAHSQHRDGATVLVNRRFDTWPMTVARTSHLAHNFATASQFRGDDASIRSWLSTS